MDRCLHRDNFLPSHQMDSDSGNLADIGCLQVDCERACFLPLIVILDPLGTTPPQPTFAACVLRVCLTHGPEQTTLRKQERKKEKCSPSVGREREREARRCMLYKSRENTYVVLRTFILNTSRSFRGERLAVLQSMHLRRGSIRFSLFTRPVLSFALETCHGAVVLFLDDAR